MPGNTTSGLKLLTRDTPPGMTYGPPAVCRTESPYDVVTSEGATMKSFLVKFSCSTTDSGVEGASDAKLKVASFPLQAASVELITSHVPPGGKTCVALIAPAAPVPPLLNP